MKSRAVSLVASVVGLALAGSLAWGDAPAAPSPGDSSAQSQPAEKPQAKQDDQDAKTPAEQRADLYGRLAAAKDADEAEGLVNLLMRSYTVSGSDTGDLLLQRARAAIAADEYPAARQILDATVALLPDWAEGWNARATVRYLDDDYSGSMADIAQTLKRDPKHIGAMMGMAAILESRNKREDALKVYEQVLTIAPHWRNAADQAEKLKAALAGQAL